MKAVQNGGILKIHSYPLNRTAFSVSWIGAMLKGKKQAEVTDERGAIAKWLLKAG